MGQDEELLLAGGVEADGGVAADAVFFGHEAVTEGGVLGGNFQA